MTQSPTPNRGPLEGVRVLDLTQALSGPFATYLLASLGAEVIKIENPTTGDMSRYMPPFYGDGGLTSTRRDDSDISLGFLNRGRGKRGMGLDLKSEEGREIFFEMVKSSHIVVENFTSGTADRLGVGYEALKAANPAIVYCSVSGFGATHEHGRGSLDAVAQALSGVMLTGGEEGEPPQRIGIPVGDTGAPLFAVIGICAALYRAHLTGVGDHVDVSMLGSLTALLAVENWQANAALGQELRTGLRLTRLTPFGSYACKGGYVSIAAPNDRSAHALFRVMGREDLITHEKFQSVAVRALNHVEVTQMIEDWASAYTPEEVTEMLDNAGVAAAPIRGPLEALEDPRVHERGEITKSINIHGEQVDDLYTVGMPIRLTNAPGSTGRPAPLAGEHTDEVLSSLVGLDAARLADLRQRGIIA